MQNFVAWVVPRRWWHWVISILTWGGVVGLLGFLSELVVQDHTNYHAVRHFWMAIITSAPLVVFAIVILRQSNRLTQDAINMASKDPLTGLLNRRAFLDALSMQSAGVLFMLDLDHFKIINDSYGHPAGDQVLCAMGHVMKSLVRKTDLVGRLGGEEFAVFVPALTPNEAQSLGERMSLGTIYLDPSTQKQISVTASVGVVATGCCDSIENMLRFADKALYHAKAAGRAQLAWIDCADDTPNAII
ncbi:GGDEF domain-containing protein [Yoonia maritima]|uniref:GGDEF domain-containing protein n=1 Tax=Yoonia maritima TaxID=1435347 RepID=UPI0013A66400|nr:GGDEF domain-containing protein [Yoonia maritima]